MKYIIVIGDRQYETTNAVDAWSFAKLWSEFNFDVKMKSEPFTGQIKLQNVRQ